ncbi:hypothetical protein HG536_0A02730 [Torulaspora globosa]|uniref:LNS2/PITP domain-containing protein n=1 Tax=Torulaspora globosa TaxID=48254 RepID=A0A7G3ZAC0_9SACH|nr:uncharacterized protein HG536_0A02730 [Torulaspora globosa]QLL30456.1 hypothetical protein HG536_0A02730 [Torulaspora globosa]
MQYFGRAIDTVSKTWSSINPATLSGAIDVIVIDHPDGTLACSPFHVRFGKFQILKPSQKKVEVIVNGKSTNIPMKLGDSGEAYFVFETTSDLDGIPQDLLSSPIVSATSSPSQSPHSNNMYLDSDSATEAGNTRPFQGDHKVLEEPDFLDINDTGTTDEQQISPNISNSSSPTPVSKTKTFQEKLNKRLTQIHIPSKLDNNGDLLLDIEGYKPNKDKVHDADNQLKQLLQDELGGDLDISKFLKEDDKGNVRIVNPYEHTHLAPADSPPFTSDESGSNLDSRPDTSDSLTAASDAESQNESKHEIEGSSGNHYIKTLRLSSDQLKCLDLKYGENDLMFSVDQGRASVTSKLFVWRWDVPIVISDIDGTITKSDALGHVMTMFGKDWTHSGVAKLFTEIARNNYNIMYLTARSTGQADSTRSYLRSILQDGNRLPSGPVILSPDRTMAALRREVILKKPEVFKIACLNDIRSLYFRAPQKTSKDYHSDGAEERKIHEDENVVEDPDERPTPFFAGFGNRITDALSYRTVGIPSSRIFTINPDGEVHMELLELAGYKSSYVFINELVDHFFPPVILDNDDLGSITSMTPGSPANNTLDMDSNCDSNILLRKKQEKKFTDVYFWRDPILDINDLSDISHSDEEKDNGALPMKSQRFSPNNKAKDALLKTDDHERFAKNVKSRSLSKEEQESFLARNNAQEETYARNFSTPKKNPRPSSKEELGRQIYLELGSPLTSPKLSHIDVQDIDSHLKNFSITRPTHPIAGVSKVNVMEDGHQPGDINSPTSGRSLNQADDLDDDIDSMDDEFDEDEFID